MDAGWFSTVARTARNMTGYQTADDVIADNTRQIAELQSQYNDQHAMSEQFKANAARLSIARNMPEARKALAQHKSMAEQASQTHGKIATLSDTNFQLRGMDSNLKMVNGMQKSNQVVSRMAGKVDLNTVDTVMDEARNHKDDHRDISERLAGRDYIDPVDDDEADAELAAMQAEFEGTSIRTQVDPRAPIPTREQTEAEARREAAILEELDRLPAVPKTIPLKFGGVPAAKSQVGVKKYK
jgi:hypothetical protein